MTFTLTQAGMMPQIQDLGRYGTKHLGFSTGGAMDKYAFITANRLLGNDDNHAQLEITVGLFAMTVNAPTIIAVCGADLGLSINGIPALNWCCHSVNTGDTISFTGGTLGCRTYIAVMGGIQSPPFVNSRATVDRLNIGGLGTGALQMHDTIPYTPITDKAIHKKHHNKGVIRSHIPDYTAPLTLDVITGYQYDNFCPHSLNTFWNTPYTLSPHHNRMGYIVQGEPLTYQGGELLSEGISMGAIQIPPNGQPIILMADSQSLGGYPKVGTVASYSLWALSQRSTGTPITFNTVSPDDAVQKRMALLDFSI